MNDVLRLGIAGLGTVGASTVRLLQTKADQMTIRCGRPVSVTAVTARDRNKDRGVDLSDCQWFDDPVQMATSDTIDVFVELMGGSEDPALSAVRGALDAGKHVITANKALLAAHGGELARLAESKGVSLNYEAAAAGGIPIVKTMREAMVANNVRHLYGIMNGTCNYILTRMELEAMSFEDCLADAQRLGYAEADPTFDIEGFDTAHKLALLTSLAFGTEIAGDDIYVEGITRITLDDVRAADELGYRIKLLGVAQQTDTGIEQRVHPTMVPKASAIAQIDGVTNAVAVQADAVGLITLAGPGAGGDATASAVISDVADIARGIRVPTCGQAVGSLRPYQRARMRKHEGGYYIRLSVFDRTGAFAAIATRMAEADISLESIVQKQPGGDDQSDDHKVAVLITHETTEQAVRDALEKITKDGHIAGQAQMIRIEKL